MFRIIIIMLIIFAEIQAAGSEKAVLYEPAVLRHDDAFSRTASPLAQGSHLKVFIPSLPYIYISHAINGALFRPANNQKGWQFDMAEDYRQINDMVYEFKLRKGVRFQDGTPFNADMVILNMEYFIQAPFLWSKTHLVFDGAEKIDDYSVRFYLKEKYGQFINDLIWLQFYTPAYLEKFGWNGKSTCPNLAEPGNYGLGPYILEQGYIEGNRQTKKAVLKANPDYWNKDYPKIQTITIYTELDTEEALKKILYQEGELDIMPIPFSRKVETILSPYAKVITAPSTNNWAVHFNLRNGNKRLLEKSVRIALNQAIDQENLLNFVYDTEGIAKPTLASPLFPGVKNAVKTIRPRSELGNPGLPEEQEQLRTVLNGLCLKVLTQERFMFLWKGIEYQLGRAGVSLEFEITKSEKDIFAQLLTTNAGKNTKNWDMLIWANDDWYYNHPWSAFLVYRTHDSWSTIFPDPVLDNYIDRMFITRTGTPEFETSVETIIKHVHDNAYMLYVPAPNQVMAVNKEVVFNPYKMACMPLWEIELTKDHYSVRQGNYPEKLKNPVQIVRFKADQNSVIVKHNN
ncbi:ABC transporter substrate-binding protein [Desulfonema limicola]|nr:ABC transporter substrate-binding protein [Desulfonema limicola]